MHNIVNKMTELTCTINNVNDLSTAQSDITSLQESVNNNTTNITTLESYTVSNGTNFGVGPGVLGNLTTGTQNTVVSNWEDALPYTITTGSNNTFIGYNTGKSCEEGSNNTFVGNNIQLTPGQTLFSGSIGLGSGVVINNSDQFVVTSNVTSFNMPGLTASTGTREGTILEFDSSGNIIPSVGTLNSVSKIDTAVSTLQSYTISDGSNFGVGPGVFNQLTIGVQNVAVGNLTALEYTVLNGSGNVMIGYNSGGHCESGNNDTFLSAYAQFEAGKTSINSSIGLGYDAIINNNNQLMVALAITSFNISGLKASTGSGEGTILEFDSSGNIIPSVGTYNTVSKIDTAISALQSNSSISTTGPFVPTFSSEVNCSATSVNSGFL